MKASTSLAIAAGVLAAFGAVPFLFPGYPTTIATEVLIFATLAMEPPLARGEASNVTPRGGAPLTARKRRPRGYH